MRFLQDAHAELIHEDASGKLYRKNLDNDEPILMVCGDDATADHTGKRRQYFFARSAIHKNCKGGCCLDFWFPGSRLQSINRVLEESPCNLQGLGNVEHVELVGSTVWVSTNPDGD